MTLFLVFIVNTVFLVKTVADVRGDSQLINSCGRIRGSIQRAATLYFSGKIPVQVFEDIDAYFTLLKTQLVQQRLLHGL
ncbi:MAG: hypothetical protein ACLFR1_07945 [Spirochaetia bacterium]